MKPYFFVAGLGLCLALFMVAGCSDFSISPRLYMTSHSYRLDIVPQGLISNATIYVPLPVNHGKPMIGSDELTDQILGKATVSVEITQAIPPGLVLNSTVPNQDPPWFLKIKASELSLNESYHISLGKPEQVQSPLSFAETRFPLGNESVFLPKIDFSSPSPDQTRSPVSWQLTYDEGKISQKIPIFVDYSASPSTDLEIFSHVGASNTWKEKYDEQAENEYDDEFDWIHTGDAHGWQLAYGTFTAAKGSYPNFSSPVWQTVINQTQPDSGKT